MDFKKALECINPVISILVFDGQRQHHQVTNNMTRRKRVKHTCKTCIVISLILSICKSEDCGQHQKNDQTSSQRTVEMNLA